MRWRSEKTGNVVDGVAAQAPVRLIVDGSAPATGTIDVYEIPEPLVSRVLAGVRRKPGRLATTLVIDPTGPAPVRAGVCSQIWEPAHLPPPQVPTRYRARLNRMTSPPLRVGGPVHFEWSHHQEGSAGVDLDVPAITGLPIPVVPRADVARGSSIVITGTAYGATDPDIELRALTVRPEVIDGLPGGPLRSYLEDYLQAVGERFDVDSLYGAFLDTYYEYMEPSGIELSVEPRFMSVGEGENVPAELNISFHGATRALLAVGVFDAQTGELLSMSALVSIKYDGESASIDY